MLTLFVVVAVRNFKSHSSLGAPFSLYVVVPQDPIEDDIGLDGAGRGGGNWYDDDCPSQLAAEFIIPNTSLWWRPLLEQDVDSKLG